MKTSINHIVIITTLIILVSCQDNGRPNYQYMPNMYEPVGYETYQESKAFKNGYEALLPAEGSIPRGDFMPYEIPDTNEGYLLAKATLKNPLLPADNVEIDSLSTEKIKEQPIKKDTINRHLKKVDYAIGKELYEVYCGICHGNNGAGKGWLVEREKILGVPSYADAGRAITTGSIYHVIYYGKNSMGSYANQLNETERWQVVAYVEKLKAELEK